MPPQGPHVAPQSPDVAPGPSLASLDPHASGSSHHDALRDDVASPRGGLDKGEPFPVGIRSRSPSASPSQQQRLREELERVHSEMSHIRELIDFCRSRGRAPPDQSHHDYERLQATYAQLSLALEESLHASSSLLHGRSPSFASHRVASPSAGHRSLRSDSSSLHGPRLSTRPRSPSQDRSCSRDDYRGHSRRSQERFVERFGSSAASTQGRRPRSWGSPSPKRLEFSRDSSSQHELQFASTESPSQHEMRFASQGSPSQHEGQPLRSERDSHQERHHLQSEWDSLLTPGLAPARDPFQGILLLKGHAPQEIPSLQGEVLLPLRDNVMSQGTQIPLGSSIHPELHLVRRLLRDPILGLLLREKTKKLRTPPCQHQSRP